MKSVSKIIDFYLYKVFFLLGLLLTIFVFVINILIRDSEIDKLTIKDKDLLAAIALAHKSENLIARDMYLYERAEEVGADLSLFSENVDQDDCMTKGILTICRNENKLILFQKLAILNHKKLGYIKTQKTVQPLFNSRLIYFLIGMILIIFLFILSGINRFVKKPLENELFNLLNNLKELDFNKNIIAIREYHEINFMFQALLTQLETSEKERGDQAIELERFFLSKQIAHDIRSPLEALKSVTTHIDDLDHTSKQIINNSIGRIADIANGLLKSTKNKNSNEFDEVNLRILVDDIINDKKFEHNIRIHYLTSIDYKNSFISGNENNLYRTISNLINNAYESQEPEKVRVEIDLFQNNHGITLKIKDFGKGMSDELIQKALNGGTTTKERGNGLGVSFSKEIVEKHNGTFAIDSVVKQGTTVIIKLPSIATPAWFTDEVSILGNTNEVVCVDDDPSFLELYKEKLKKINKSILTYSEKKVDEIQLNKNSQFYFDYDLGNGKTGLEFIINHNLSSRSTLVTSMHQDEKIQKECIEHGIKILPKQVFNNANVINASEDLEGTKDRLEQLNKVVFIDDDYLMHMSWKMEADQKGINLDCYHTIDEFLGKGSEYDLKTKIFIDSNLKDGIKGEIESEKIAKLGFTELFLATGYSASDIDKPEWIKEVVGKRAKF